MVSVSVVVPSRDEGAFIGATVSNLLAELPEDGEVVIVDDGSVDDSVAVLAPDPRVVVVRNEVALGPAGARNRGATVARGEILVFSDAHVEPVPGWLPLLCAPLDDPTVGATGPVLCDLRVREAKGHGLRFCDAATSLAWLPRAGNDPYPVPVLAGFFVVMRRAVFDDLGGFDDGMLVYGMEDPELSVHLWARGYQCVLVPSVEVAHLYRDPQPDYQFDWETGLHNILRLGVVHFGPRRLAGMITHHRAQAAFPASAVRLALSSAISRRATIDARRVHDDDWYFDRFDMDRS